MRGNSLKLDLFFSLNAIKDPGDFVTNVKQINSQSDLIWMRSLPARLTSQSDPLSTSF